ncbi:hypothetical protein [Mycobacteroides chelonae]
MLACDLCHIRGVVLAHTGDRIAEHVFCALNIKPLIHQEHVGVP